MMIKSVAKAQGKEDQSEAIVVSFGHEWLKQIKEKKIELIIRKRAPIQIEPRLMYMHFNAPCSAICAKAKIDSLKKISVKDALGEAVKLGLREDEISKYFGDLEEMFCYRVSDIEFSKTQITSSEINTRIKYYPPQSFFVLSKQAMEILDSMLSI